MISVVIRIEAPHFVAGVWAVDGVVVRTAPILAYMLGWSTTRVFNYTRSKDWQAQQVAQKDRLT